MPVPPRPSTGSTTFQEVIEPEQCRCSLITGEIFCQTHASGRLRRNQPARRPPLDRPLLAKECRVYIPICELIFDDASFGYRRGRSAKDALRKIWREIQSGSEWIVDADLRDSGPVDHEKLFRLVAQQVADGRVSLGVRAVTPPVRRLSCAPWPAYSQTGGQSHGTDDRLLRETRASRSGDHRVREGRGL